MPDPLRGARVTARSVHIEARAAAAAAAAVTRGYHPHPPNPGSAGLGIIPPLMPPPLITIPETEIKLEDGTRHLVQPFCTPRRAVTLQEYARFARETAYVTTAERARRPHTFRHHYAIDDLSDAEKPSVRATLVSWYDATAYCEWAGGRLPSQEEWLAAAVRDWRTEVPRTPWVTAAQGQYEEDPAYIFIECPEWTGTECDDERAIVRGHPRYFLIEGWRSDPLQNRRPHPKSFADTGIGFRVRLAPGAAPQ